MELNKGKTSKPTQIDDGKIWGEKKPRHFSQRDPNKWTKSKPIHISINDDQLWGDKKLRHFSQRDQKGGHVKMAEPIVHPTQSEILAWIGSDQVI